MLNTRHTEVAVRLGLLTSQPLESQAARSRCLDFVLKIPSTFEFYERLVVFYFIVIFPIIFIEENLKYLYNTTHI